METHAKPTLLFRVKSQLDQWLKHRLPQTREVTLRQRQIFIVPTQLALGMLLLTLLLFILGINFQNSLVYAVCFWLLALLVLNILHTYRNLAGLTLKVIGIEPCFAGENALLTLELSCEADKKKYAVQLGWPEHDLSEVNLAESNHLRVQLAYPTQRRGRWTPPRITVRTHYPLGLAVAWSYLLSDISGLVYPKPQEQTALQPNIPNHSEHSSGHEIPGGSHDFGGIRDYQPGDAPRRIHWAKYAQTGELHSKTFIDYSSPECWLDWDALPFPDAEARLSHLCSQVLTCHAEQQEYGLNIPGTRLEPQWSEAHKNRCLTALALFGTLE